MKKIALLLCFCTALLFSMVGCNNVKPDGLRIVSMPNKTIYNVGETELDLNGGEIAVKYSDGSTGDTVSMTNSAVTTTGFDTSSIGVKTITIKYLDQTGTFNIVVQEPQETMIEVRDLPLITTYGTYVNASHINLLGGSINVLYNDYSVSRTVSMTDSGVSVAGLDAESATVKKVRIKYGDFICTFDISINSSISGHLVVKDLPTNTTYRSTATVADVKLNGGTFAPCLNGINGNDISMTANGVSVTAIDTTKGIVSISYSGMIGAFPVEILQNWENSIEIITPPTNTTGYNYDTVPANVSLTGITANVLDNEGNVVKAINASDLVATKITVVYAENPNKAKVTVKYVGDSGDIFAEFEISVSLDNIMKVKYYTSLIPSLDWLTMPRLTAQQEEAGLKAFEIFNSLSLEDQETLSNYKNSTIRNSFYIITSRLFEDWSHIGDFFSQDGLPYENVDDFIAFTEQLLEDIDDCVDVYEPVGYIATFENKTIADDLYILTSLTISETPLANFVEYIGYAGFMYDYIKDIEGGAFVIAEDYTDFTDSIMPIYNKILEIVEQEKDVENSVALNITINTLLYWKSDAVDIIYEYFYYQEGNNVPGVSVVDNEYILDLLNANVYNYDFLYAIYYTNMAYETYLSYDDPIFLNMYFYAEEFYTNLFRSSYSALKAVFIDYGYQRVYNEATQVYQNTFSNSISYLSDAEFKTFVKDFLTLVADGWYRLPNAFPVDNAEFAQRVENLILRFYDLAPDEQFVFYSEITYSALLSGYFGYETSYFSKVLEDYFKLRLTNISSVEDGLDEYGLWQYIDGVLYYYNSIYYNGLNGTDLYYFLYYADFVTAQYSYVNKSNTFEIYVRPIYDMLNIKYQETRDISVELIDALDYIYFGLDAYTYYDGRNDSVANYLIAFHWGAKTTIEALLLGADSTTRYFYETFRFIPQELGGQTIKEMHEDFNNAYNSYFANLPYEIWDLYGDIMFNGLVLPIMTQTEYDFSNATFVQNLLDLRTILRADTLQELMFISTFYGFYFQVLNAYYSANLKVGGKESPATVNALMQLETSYFMYLMYNDSASGGTGNQRYLTEFFYLMNKCEVEYEQLTVEEKEIFNSYAPFYNDMHTLYLTNIEISGTVFNVYDLMKQAYNAFYNALDGNGDFSQFLLYYYQAVDVIDALTGADKDAFEKYFESILLGEDGIEEQYSYVVDIYYLGNDDVDVELATKLEEFLRMYVIALDAYNNETDGYGVLIEEVVGKYYELDTELQFMFRAGIAPNDYPDMVYTYYIEEYSFDASQSSALRNLLLSEFYYLGSLHGIEASRGYYSTMFEKAMQDLKYYYDMFKDNIDPAFITHFGQRYQDLLQILQQSTQPIEI